MSLHYSIKDLKTIRRVYCQLGITDSEVLNQVNESIRLSYYSEPSIEEIQDELTMYLKALDGNVDTDVLNLIEKTNMIGSIMVRSRLIRSVNITPEIPTQQITSFKNWLGNKAENQVA